MATTDYAIGIDLGTTYSCVSVYKDGKVEIIPNEHGENTTPSYVAFNAEERLVGKSAKNQASSNPLNTVYDAKRLIGKKYMDKYIQDDIKSWSFKVTSGKNEKPVINVEWLSEKKVFTPEEISSMILSKMKETAENYLGGKVTKAVITVPAYFDNSQRQATKDAGKIAGLEVLRIINEPTSAAIAYGLNKKYENEHNVLIFDLGGGTFDVSLLTLIDGIFEVKATSGDTHLGGEDFDLRLMNCMITEFQKKFPQLDPRGNPKSMRRLKTACEQAKRTLSSSSNAEIDIDMFYKGEDLKAKISRAKFEEINSEIFKKCMIPVEQVLKDSGMKKRDIHEVVLVGGSTRIPKICNMLSEYFNDKKLCKSINPDECVAFGAAVQAAILNGNQAENIDVLLIDVIPLTLGIMTSGGIMTNLIRRNEAIPVKKSQDFSTNKDNQTTVTIEIFQGERHFTKDNILLGQFDLFGIEPKPRGIPKIEICYDVDANGILSVTAKDKNTTNEKTIQINNDTIGLNTEQIDKMVQDAEKYKEQDTKKYEKIEANNKLLNYTYAIRNLLGAIDKTALTEPELLEDITFIEEVCYSMFDWIDENPHEPAEVFKQRREEMEELTKPIIEQLNKVLEKQNNSIEEIIEEKQPNVEHIESTTIDKNSLNDYISNNSNFIET